LERRRSEDDAVQGRDWQAAEPRRRSNSRRGVRRDPRPDTKCDSWQEGPSAEARHYDGRGGGGYARATGEERRDPRAVKHSDGHAQDSRGARPHSAREQNNGSKQEAYQNRSGERESLRATRVSKSPLLRDRDRVRDDQRAVPRRDAPSRAEFREEMDNATTIEPPWRREGSWYASTYGGNTHLERDTAASSDRRESGRRHEERGKERANEPRDNGGMRRFESPRAASHHVRDQRCERIQSRSLPRQRSRSRSVLRRRPRSRSIIRRRSKSRSIPRQLRAHERSKVERDVHGMWLSSPSRDGASKSAKTNGDGRYDRDLIQLASKPSSGPAVLDAAVVDGVPRSDERATWRAEVSVPRPGQPSERERGGVCIRGPNRFNRDEAERDLVALQNLAHECVERKLNAAKEVRLLANRLKQDFEHQKHVDSGHAGNRRL